MHKEKGSFLRRIFRSIFSVIVLSAFIIGITFIVKGIHSTSEIKLVKYIHKVLSFAKVNVDEEKVGEVAGKFIERINSSNISSSSSVRVNGTDKENVSSSDNNLVLEVALISDVHEDFASLQRSINLIKEKNIKCVIVMSDLTNFGDVKTLTEIKKILDDSGLVYYTLPGDHDLAASMGSDNFVQVFGKNNYVIDLEGFKFLFLDNSANYTPLLASTIDWFNDEVKNSDFVILSQPLFTDGLNLPFKKMFMGSTPQDTKNDLIENQTRVKSQRDIILQAIQQSNVLAVLAGDHHKSNMLSDSVRSSLEHHTLGSISNELNGLPQRILQSPRFSLLKVYEDKSIKFEEVLID